MKQNEHKINISVWVGMAGLYSISKMVKVDAYLDNSSPLPIYAEWTLPLELFEPVHFQ